LFGNISLILGSGQKNCEVGDAICRAFVPSGVLVKTILLHAGQRMKQYNAGSRGTIDLGAGTPDVYQGFGRIQLTNTLPLSGVASFLLFVRDLVTIGEYSVRSRTFKVTGNSRPIRATLTWYDPPASASTTSKALINDLDLILTSPSNQIYYSNQLSNYDRKNNVEQVIINSPVTGIWTLSVQSNALPYSQQQRFSVAMSCLGVTLYTTTAEIGESIHFENNFDDVNQDPVDGSSQKDGITPKIQIPSSIFEYYDPFSSNEEVQVDKSNEESEEDNTIPEISIIWVLAVAWIRRLFFLAILNLNINQHLNERHQLRK